MAAKLKILVLGGCQQADIAVRLGADEEVIATAEALFFDVGGQLEATAWIVSEAIAAALREGDTGLAVQMRLAFLGGPMMAQAIVDSPERVPPLEADRLVDQSTLLHVKLQEALAVPLRSDASTLKFLKIWVFRVSGGWNFGPNGGLCPRPRDFLRYCRANEWG